MSPTRRRNGTITFDLRSAIKDFGNNKRGVVTAFLRDFDPAGAGTYTTIATGTLDVANWQGGSGTWVTKSLTMTASNYTVAAGHRIGLKVIVGSAAADNMWFAYDTTAYPSAVTIP